MPEDVGSVRQQIGEILGTVKGLADTLREVKEDRIRQEDRISEEIRTIKHEQRQNDQVVTGRLELLASQFRDLGSKVTGIVDEVSDVKKEVATVASMRTNVDKLVQFRDRMIAYVVVTVSICGVLWSFLSPFLQSIFSHYVIK